MAHYQSRVNVFAILFRLYNWSLLFVWPFYALFVSSPTGRVHNRRRGSYGQELITNLNDTFLSPPLITDDCDKEGTSCSNGVCLDSLCHCNDGYGGCNCQVQGKLEEWEQLIFQICKPSSVYGRSLCIERVISS